MSDPLRRIDRDASPSRGRLPSDLGKPSRGQIVDALRSAYGQLDAPKYGFVLERFRHPPESLLNSLRKFASLVDQTDINEEVSWGFDVHSAGEHVGLRLSMVGPYAVVFRHTSEYGRLALMQATPSLTVLERSVLRSLDDAGWFVLSSEDLRTRVPMRIYKVGEEYQCLWQALMRPQERFPEP